MMMVAKLVTKLVGAMTAGEMMRFRHRGKMLLGIVADCDFVQIPSGRVILLLEDLPDRPGTSLGFVKMSDFLLAGIGLSYGNAHEIVVHPGALVVSDTQDQFSTNGALIVDEKSRAIRSRYLESQYNEFALLIDTSTWTAIQPTDAQSRRVAVLAWELRLLPEVPLAPSPSSVFTFAPGG